MTTAPRLHMTIQYASEATDVPARAAFRRWARAALIQNVVATLRLVDEDEGRQLNQEYRGKAKSTNVLTFAYGLDEAGSAWHGDIVLCVPVVEREAREQGKTLDAHYAHLTLHGLLHLQGYDHEVEAEAVAMEAVESFIMMRLGYPDPYQDG